ILSFILSYSSPPFFIFFFFLLTPRPPCSTLFPYTTLFRSIVVLASQAIAQPRAHAWPSGLLMACLQIGDGRVMIDSLRVHRPQRSEEHTSELQSHLNLVCRLLLEKKNNNNTNSLTRLTNQ